MKYPFDKVSVGESFEIPKPQANVTPICATYGARLGRRFTTKALDRNRTLVRRLPDERADDAAYWMKLGAIVVDAERNVIVEEGEEATIDLYVEIDAPWALMITICVRVDDWENGRIPIRIHDSLKS